ncbi:MAG TPA: hypothetical protein PKW32_14020 [Verrucomicrobiota bacterium]|nr:hypothetical protein [Verrucomicrobiota bacterium]
MVLALILPAFRAAAFDGHNATEGPVTVLIAPVPLATNYGEPRPVRVTVSNASPQPIPLSLVLTGLVDECYAVGASRAAVTVPARGSSQAEFALAAGKGAYSALYPVRIDAEFTADGRTHRATAIRIFTNDFSALPRPAVPVGVIRVPESGAVPLAARHGSEISWQRFGQPPQLLGAGWTGSDDASGAHFAVGPVSRGETRQSIQVHPPYRGGPGTLFASYRLALPQTPARLVFFQAIRDHGPTEPPSDGVTFRVWANGEPIFERHSASKTWVPGEASLERFRGRQIELRLETHPGPKQDTTCDSAFWGDPVVVAGPTPVRLSPAEKAELHERARRAVRMGEAAEGVHLFDLGGECRAAVALGPNGLADGALAFGGGRQAVVLESMQMRVLDLPVGGWPAGAAVDRVAASKAGGRLRVEHRIQTADGPGELVAEAWAEGPGLRIRIASDRRITDLAPGAADRLASRVYYGHGYCIDHPEPFRAASGGHNLASSHVGFEFDNGVALLVAADTPVDHLDVDPASKTYALHTHPDSIYTFVPGRKGAMDCAIRYRPIYDRKPAPAVGLKAGRFVFDLWGGRYAEDAARLSRCFDYGLTNSLVIMHVWQRWGYDYRLPDIFPPLPSLGTLEELRGLGRLCRQRGALWGLHDNYIDIYPDCDGFSYENVTFTAEGQPRKAWFNEGRNAQSYQFRPDRAQPFLRRNLDQIAPALEPTSYFVDVWASINAFDYYDRRGAFHSKMETLRCWGDGFDAIRQACGGGPAISEAGSDQLIGWLDGADCQFLHLSPSGGPFNNRVACRDWARVPWLDAVHHTRFSLHGVGYPGRYEGGRGRSLHGISSDDYLSAEILTGHALMIDLSNLGREAVRKYWLAQPFIESVAMDEIAQVDFVDGHMHRLCIRWSSGAEVYVNRGGDDWTVAGRVLPQFGFLARNGPIESSIERLDGQIVERSSRPGAWYVNGRGFQPDAPLLIQPEFAGFKPLGERQFSLQVNWQAQRPAPIDLRVFYHFSRPVPGRYRPAEFSGGGDPPMPASEWQGAVATDFTVAIPGEMEPGEYTAAVGLFNPRGEGGRRYPLLGDDASDRRYRIGKLILSGAKGRITGIRFEPTAAAFRPNLRLLPNERPAQFGAIATAGALRIVRQIDRLLLTPLPDSEGFAVVLDPNRLLGRPLQAPVLTALDAQGRRGRSIPADGSADAIRFTVAQGDFGYELSGR